MKKKLIFLFIILFLATLILAADSPYARRIKPVIAFGACTENEIAYDMVLHKLGICTNTGFVPVATGTGITVNATNGIIPYRTSATTFADSPITRNSASEIKISDGIIINGLSAGGPVIYGAAGGGFMFFGSVGFANQTIIRGDYVDFTTTAGDIARFNAAGNFIWPTDNTYDIGASGATRPRTGYFGTSLVSPLFLGNINFTSAVWNISSDSKNRLYFSTNDSTYFGTGGTGGYIWQDTSNANLIQLTASTTPVFSIQSDGTIGFGNSTTDPGGVDAKFGRTATGIIKVTNIIQITPLTVATLPTCNSTNEGSMSSVTDALAPTFLVTISGGGSVHAPVFCNGTNWIAH